MRITGVIRLMLLSFFMLAIPATAFAQIAVSITIAPPELPVYEQPVCPGDGYIWTPGYWAYDYDAADYYWVPGTWVEAPEVGFFWTPGYWGWGGDAFIFHEGYWGPTIGFYGGIDYGFGYVGHGYEGGRWDNGHFFYNRSVNNINVTEIHNVYNTTVVNETRVARVSYNGGNGGVNARATSQEEAAARERHVPPVAAQTQHVEAARTNPELRASTNHGKPPIAATSKPGAFQGGGVVAAKEGGRYNPPARTEGNGAHPDSAPPARSGDAAAHASSPAVHARDLPAPTRPAPPNTGNPKVDQKYQQQQDKLSARQDQERQKLQQKQDQEHQQLANQKADQARTQQLEQKHQQQTQQLQQRHTQQQQQLQQKQQPPHSTQPKPPGGKPQ
jgi:hypothetical protein